VALVAPLLFWIGYYKKETSRQAYEMLLLLGFSAAGYHLYNLIVQLSTVTGVAHKD
jgi:hypothetical protein